MAFGLLLLSAACGGGETMEDPAANASVGIEPGGNVGTDDGSASAATDGNLATDEGNAVGPIEGDTNGSTDGGNAVASGSATYPVVVDTRVTRSGPVAVPLNPRRPGPLFAPNGYEWPSAAGYLQGYQLLRSGGPSSVTVDNGANDSKVFVKLVAVDAAGATVVRHVFIPAYGSFTMAGVSAGTYDVRYMNLWDGSMVGTEPFTLSQTHVTMTLYKVPNGNMRTHALRRDQF